MPVVTAVQGVWLAHPVPEVKPVAEQAFAQGQESSERAQEVVTQSGVSFLSPSIIRCGQRFDFKRIDIDFIDKCPSSFDSWNFYGCRLDRIYGD